MNIDPNLNTNKNGVELTQRDFALIGLKQSNRRLVFELHQACKKGDTLLKLLRVAADRITPAQLTAARGQLETHLKAVEAARLTNLMPSAILSEANVQILFLNRSEQSLITHNGPNLNKGSSAQLIGQMNRDALNKAMRLEDVGQEFKKLELAFELFESEKACIERLIELPQQAEKAVELGREVQALKINLYIIAKSLCILACSRKAVFEASVDKSASKDDISPLGSGPIASYMKRMTELTKPGDLNKPLPAATADSKYRDDTVALLLDNGAEVRGLALEIANAYFLELSELPQRADRLTADQLQQAEEILQTGFLMALKLIDSLDWTGGIHPQARSVESVQPNSLAATDTATSASMRQGGSVGSLDSFDSTGSDSEVKKSGVTPSDSEVGVDETDPFEALAITGRTQADVVNQRAEKLIAEPVLPTLLKLQKAQLQAQTVQKGANNTRTSSVCMPDTAEHLLRTEIQAANRLSTSIQKLMRRESLSPNLKALLAKKLEEIQQKIDQARQPSLISDMIKTCPVPNSFDWVRLLETGELMQVGRPRLLANPGHPLVELSIQPKPLSTGEPAPKVWLHIHLKEGCKTPAQKKLNAFLKNHLNQPAATNPIAVAHLKSDFYRGKGKNWEKTQRELGHMEMLVKRSPVPLEFVGALLNKADGLANSL